MNQAEVKDQSWKEKKATFLWTPVNPTFLRGKFQLLELPSEQNLNLKRQHCYVGPLGFYFLKWHRLFLSKRFRNKCGDKVATKRTSHTLKADVQLGKCFGWDSQHKNQTQPKKKYKNIWATFWGHHGACSAKSKHCSGSSAAQLTLALLVSNKSELCLSCKHVKSSP